MAFLQSLSSRGFRLIAIAFGILACVSIPTDAMEQQPHLPTLDRTVEMEGDGCSEVRWTVDAEAGKLKVSFKSAPGAEWVGFGVSEYGSMKGADIMLVKMIENEGIDTFVVEDLIATEFSKPEKDILQNVELLYAALDEDGKIQAVVERPLDSCDIDDIAIESYKQSVVCASGYLDDNHEIAYHGPTMRSSTLINFMVDEDLLFYGSLGLSTSENIMDMTSETLDANGIVTARAVGENLRSTREPVAVDIQMPNVTLPENQVSSFFCVAFRIPDTLSMRTIGVETVWGNGQVRGPATSQPTHIHHQVLFHCDGAPEDGTVVEGQAYDCGSGMPICPINTGLARTPLTKFPPGVHSPLNAG